MDGAKGLKGLETWAKRVTEGYRDVNVKDMCVSFRDGLAFCAIIHHHRPDLIDFESLSKEDILQNNSLAFSTAEKQLGVPALLDAEDMVKYTRPDRLSIITYLSQLHNCFVHQNKVNNRMKDGLKRILSNGESGPPPKIADVKINAVTRHEVCQSCKHRVFLLERLIISGKLYHRTCFRCNKCNSLLKPGAFVESDSMGLYECAVCPHDEKEVTQSPPAESSPEPKHKVTVVSPRAVSPERKSPALHSKQSLLTSSVSSARNSFLQKSLTAEKENDVKKFSYVSSRIKDSAMETDSDAADVSDLQTPTTGVSVKDKISVFESSRVTSPTAHPVASSSKTDESTDTGSSMKSPTLTKLSTPKHKISSSSFLQSPTSVDIKSSSVEDSSGDSPLVKSSDAIVPSSDLAKIPSSVPPTVENKLQTCDDADGDATLDIKDKPHQLPSLFPKDIFQTNIRPLKLSIHTVSNNVEKKEVASSPITPAIKSPDSAKTPTFNIPHIRSSYLNSTLPRQRSYTPLSAKEISPIAMESNSESNLNDILHNRWSNTKPRRSSLESDAKGVTSPDTASPTIPVAPMRRMAKNIGRSDSLNELKFTSSRREIDISKKSISDNNSLLNTPLTKRYLGSEVDSSEKESVAVAESKLKTSQELIDRREAQTDYSTLQKTEIEAKIMPVPRARHSLSVSKVKTSLDKKYEVETSPVVSEQSSETVTSVSLNSQSVSPEKRIAGVVSPFKIRNENSPRSEIGSKVPETSKASLSVPTVKVQESKSVTQEESQELYPDDLNPFGDEENDDDETKAQEEYPDDLNPFGDDEPDQKSQNDATEYDESKNPFASDDDDDDQPQIPQSKELVFKTQSSFTSDRSPFKQFSPYSGGSSPTGSLTGTMKKRRAPKPPMLSEIFPTDSLESQSDVSLTSLQVSPSPNKRTINTPSPKIRKSKPAPPPPPTGVKENVKSSAQDSAASKKQMKEMNNMQLKSSIPEQQDSDESTLYKKKKRPAPPVPIPPRREIKKIPLKEIQQEMKEIEEKQEELEKQGRDLEVLIRDRDKDEEPTVEEEENIMQLFELVNQKNSLFRRQAELMYIKRSQRLEEEQVELEFQIRLLMTKPAFQKTDDDADKETDLMQRLLDVVDQRNEIIDSIEMDRRRELEEDVSVQEQIEIKNGDLPITAEIKEKSKQKAKKSKHKKDKKKKSHDEAQEGEDSGKNTLKKGKKGWFSKPSE